MFRRVTTPVRFVTVVRKQTQIDVTGKNKQGPKCNKPCQSDSAHAKHIGLLEEGGQRYWPRPDAYHVLSTHAMKETQLKEINASATKLYLLHDR